LFQYLEEKLYLEVNPKEVIKMKIFRIRTDDASDVYLKQEEIEEWLGNFDPHEEIAIKVIEMTEEEYKKLPEFTG